MNQKSPNPENIRFQLAPCYVEMARKERHSLAPHQDELLDELEDVSREAALIAHLYLIDRERRRLNIDLAQLCGEFRDVTPSAVGKWFTLGEIKSPHYAHLIRLPAFRNISPQDEEVREHGARCMVTWIRKAVLGDGRRKRVRTIGYDHLHFVAALHQIDDSNFPTAFELLPRSLYERFGPRAPGWLFTLNMEWGRAYRLLAWEREYGD